MLVLLSLLQSRRDWPGQQLAARLEISDRTVRRDVDRLRELGYRISATKGPDGGYRLDAGSELPPLLFDDDQAIALAVALRSAAVIGSGFEEAALRALTTVRQVLPARLRHRVDALRFTAVSSSPGGQVPVDPAVLLQVGAAIAAAEVLRFDHVRPDIGPATGADDDPRALRPPREVEPHHLVSRNGRWYLVAWDLDRVDWRVFRVDRITPRAPTGRRYTRAEDPGGHRLPGDDVAAFVGARFKGSTDGDVWPCRGSVILSMPAATVMEYAGDWTVEGRDDDRCLVTGGAWSWVGLAASIGRFDADVEVVGPPELADAFAHLSRRFQAAVPVSLADHIESDHGPHEGDTR